jgi:glycosyltransferase involved in cell wall biosynthesis
MRARIRAKEMARWGSEPLGSGVPINLLGLRVGMSEFENSGVLWVGGVFDEATLLARRAASPAANRWQIGLIRGIAATRPVRVLAHVPEPLWPRGEGRITSLAGKLADGITGDLVRYWNFPGVRSTSLASSYIAAFQRHCTREGRPAVVVTYNDWPWSVALGRYVQDRHGIPWVCIVADGPGSGPALAAHEARIAGAAGRVYLSWGRYQAALCPRLHLDGGIAGLQGADETEPAGDGDQGQRVVLFTGAMNRWAGASLLVEAFRGVRSDATLWLCGPGINADVQQAAAAGRVRSFGLVGEERLRALCARADVFVNPRPTDLHENRSNFPSKVLEYLTWQKPVVSTWTEGLDPAYRAVLEVADPADASNLAAAIDRALSMSGEALSRRRAASRDFLIPGKLWTTQTDRLLEWLWRTGIARWSRPSAGNGTYGGG